MAWSDCIADIRAASGRDLSLDEIERISEAVQVRMTEKIRNGVTARDAASAAGKELSGEMKLKAMLAKRDAYNNMLIRADLHARVGPGQEVAAQQAVLTGRAKKGLDNANSVDANHHSLRAQLLGPAVAALEKAKLLRALTGGFFGRVDRAFDLDVARELFRRKDPASGADTGNAMAKQAAEILGQVMDAGKAMQNKAGAWIHELDNYMGRQYHDMLKVRGKGPRGEFEPWRDEMMQRLDLAKSFKDVPPDQIEAALRRSWHELATGVFDASEGSALNGYIGPGNLGKKVSQGRSFIFKSADDWFAYNEKFGKGGVMDAIVNGADKAARDTALMQAFGTNPSAMFDRWTSELATAAKDRGDLTLAEKLKSSPNKGLFNVVSGVSLIPSNAKIAYIGATARNMTQLLHLGQVIFSAFPDIVTTSATLHANGIPYHEALAAQLRAILPQSVANKDIAHSLGAGIDGMMGHIVHRFRTEEGVPGKMAEAVNIFHKLNGLTYWTEAQKVGTGLALSHWLARQARTEFEKLPESMQTVLQRYGIEAKEWDVGRSSSQKAADGRYYLLPAEIADEKVAQKFQTYIIDQMREGINEPTALAKYYTSLGTATGTPVGEIVRTLTQFKSFTATYMERHMGRVLKRDGFDLPGVVYLMAGMTLAGYIGVTLKDLTENKTPRAPSIDLFRDALVKGGALGLLGDVMLNAYAKSGGDVAKSFAGPVFAHAADMIGAMNSIREGQKTHDRGHIAAKMALDTLGAPLLNVIAVKQTYAYLFNYMLQEKLTPGTVRKHEKAMKDAGQTYVLRP